MNLERAYLRADISRSIGLGHISRVIAMAKALEHKGVQPVVFCRDLDDNWNYPIAKIERQGSLVRKIMSEAEFIAALKMKDAKYLFIDLLEADSYATLVSQLKTLMPSYCSICFDSFFEEDLAFDFHIGPSFDGISPYKNGLSGLQYFVFPEELRQLAPTKVMRENVHRVLITLGGRDPFHATSAIANTLCSAFPLLHFTVVIGPGFSEGARGELLNLARKFRNLECAMEPEHLGHLYVASDFAIVSGGQTKFETALFGIPSFIVGNTSQEEELSKQFASFGASVFMGGADQLDQNSLCEQFANLIAQSGKLREMSRKGRQMLDIHGGERIFEYIQQNLP